MSDPRVSEYFARDVAKWRHAVKDHRDSVSTSLPGNDPAALPRKGTPANRSPTEEGHWDPHPVVRRSRNDVAAPPPR